MRRFSFVEVDFRPWVMIIASLAVWTLFFEGWAVPLALAATGLALALLFQRARGGQFTGWVGAQP